MKKVYLSPAGLRDIQIGLEGIARLEDNNGDEIDASSYTALENARAAIEEFLAGTSYDNESGERYIEVEE